MIRALSMAKTYFISGASSGIGEELARQLVARGDAVALAARRTDRLEAVAASLATGPGTVSVHRLDVTDTPEVDRVMRRAHAVHGGLDVVVVNAGRGGGGRLGTGREAENRAVMETNLVGALAQIETAMSIFRERGRGHLVLMSSVAGNRAVPGGGAVYSATKASVAALGESLRTEMAGSGVVVTTLRPGFIATDLTARAGTPYKSSLPRSVTAMIKAIDAGVDDRVVPAWPWRPLSLLFAVTPRRLLRRFF